MTAGGPAAGGVLAAAGRAFAAVFGRTVSDTGWIGVARGGLRLRLFVRERRGTRRLFLRLRLRGGDVVAELRPEDAERLSAGLDAARAGLGRPPVGRPDGVSLPPAATDGGRRP